MDDFDNTFKKSNQSLEQLYIAAECKADRYNENCLALVAGIMILCILLNEIGIFVVNKQVMIGGAGLSSCFFLLPRVISLLTGWISHGSCKIEERSWFKYVIIVFSFLGVLMANIVLTHHTTLMLAIPMFNMAQYKNIQKLIPIGMILATICVIAGVYLGYFYGLIDYNLVEIGYRTNEAALDYSMRATLATPTRMWELFLHYALPREITILALLILAYATSQRNRHLIETQAALQEKIEQQMERTNRMQNQVIEGMANLIENRDMSTGEHVKRTGVYVEMITELLKKQKRLTDEEAEDIIKAAPLHDIGKIAVADRVLQKPGKLTPEEYEEIKTHSAAGEKVVEEVFANVDDEKFLKIAIEISGSHHERWDGKGYPHGLKGEEIPLPARIMAVADVFDALVSKRIYKEPMEIDQAFQIIAEGSGTQFDSDIVKVFLQLRPKIEAYAKQANEK